MSRVRLIASEGRWLRLLSVSRPNPRESEGRHREDWTPNLHTVIASAVAGAAFEVLVASRGTARKVIWCSRADGHGGAFPPSSTFVPVGANEVQAVCDEFEWVSTRIGLHDVLEGAEPSSASQLEELLLHSEPIAWMVFARPVQLGTSDEPRRLARLMAQGDTGTVVDRLRAERAARVLGLLERETPAGVWELTLHAGARTVPEATALLAQLISLGGTSGLPCSISSAAEPTSTLVTSSVVALWTRPPRVEVPGVRVVGSADWDFTPESRGPVAVGAVMEPAGERSRGRMSVSLDTINRHVFVTGATGSGKSTTVRNLLTQLSSSQVPWLVVEPAKSEYHSMVEAVDAPVSVIRLGAPEARGFSLNPLEPTSVGSVDGRRTFNLATHMALTRNLFEAAFDAEEPFPQILALALDRAYRCAGWNPITGQSLGCELGEGWYPTLGELRAHALDIVDEIGYGREVRDNVRGFVDVRINGLRHGAAGVFFEGGSPLDLEEIASTNVILQIEDLGNERDQAFLIGTVLVRWVELLRLRGDSGGKLNHVLVIEEAHRLLRDVDGPSRGAIEQFANILAEVRSYGQGVVIAEQIPSKLIVDVIKNSALKIVHRLPARDDRDVVGATMNLSDAQSEAVVSLRPGRAIVHADGMDRPVPVSVVEAVHTSTVGSLQAPSVRRRVAACPDRCAAGNACSAEGLDVVLPFAGSSDFAAWVDLSAVARLVGEDLPLPDLATVTRWRSRLRKRDLLVCALAETSVRSVRARSNYIAEYYPPADLACHLTNVLSSWLIDGTPPSKAPEWQIAEYRWRDVYISLLAARTSGASQAADGVLESAARRGLALPRTSLEEQISWLEQWQVANSVPPSALLYGAGSVLRQALLAAGVLSVPDLAQRLGCQSEWIGGRYGHSTASSQEPSDGA